MTTATVVPAGNAYAYPARLAKATKLADAALTRVHPALTAEHIEFALSPEGAEHRPALRLLSTLAETREASDITWRLVAAMLRTFEEGMRADASLAGLTSRSRLVAV
jgi:hypothetical protein